MKKREFEKDQSIAGDHPNAVIPVGFYAHACVLFLKFVAYARYGFIDINPVPRRSQWYWHNILY